MSKGMSRPNCDGDGPLVRAVGISAGYGSGLVIRDIGLEVNQGEVVALLGANGAGKTTTLLTLAGELRPAAGRVVWNGSDRRVALHRRACQGFAFVPEEGAVFTRLTTRQNLALARRSDQESATRIFPALRDLLDRRGGLLSGGEQRMLAVGRALGGATRLLVADELSLGLAPRTVGVILEAIRAAAERGMGALIVEQHVHRVLQFADRVYVMQRGRITLEMTAAEASANIDEIQAQYLTAAAQPDQVDGRGSDGHDLPVPSAAADLNGQSRRQP